MKFGRRLPENAVGPSIESRIPLPVSALAAQRTPAQGMNTRGLAGILAPRYHESASGFGSTRTSGLCRGPASGPRRRRLEPCAPRTPGR